MVAEQILGWGGVTICGLVGAKMLTTVADSLQRYAAARTRFQLRNRALRAELDRLSRVATTTEQITAWEGWRKFRVHSKVREAEGCHSIYIVPHDGKPLPAFQPGQFLTLSIRPPGSERPVVRCYSLSETPNDQYYRCTIKKVAAPSPKLPAGRASSFVNDTLQEGDIIDVKAPRGQFYLDTMREEPVVLLAGGVGITPLLSMVNSVAATGSRRTVHMFCGFRNSREHLFKTHLQQLHERFSNIHIHTVYSAPAPDDALGRDHDAVGHVSIEHLRATLPSNNFDYYLCGPGPFMQSLHAGLQSWGVPPESIRTEAFGPAAVTPSVATPAQPQQSSATAATGVQVCFSRSNVTVTWDTASESLLDLAERNGVAIDSGCRAGNCGTCLAAIKRGNVRYMQQPAAEVSDGSCLTCIAAPSTDIELDA